MYKKYHYIYSALIASLAVSACSSDAQKFEGRLAIERDACLTSGGVYKAGDGSVGDSSCKCDFGNGLGIECFGSWVCDKDNLTCRECVDGDTRCFESNQKTQIKTCVAGKWTNEIDCDTEACSEDQKTCAPKEECKSGCDGNILITCSKDNGVIKKECVVCDESDGLPKCKCSDDYNKCDGNGKLIYCEDGVKWEKECNCENNQCINKTTDKSCNNEGQSQCINLSALGLNNWKDETTDKEFQLVQQQCTNNQWATIKGCEECHPNGTMCADKNEQLNCPAECPNDCTDGVCNTHEDNCPAECPNDCTDGVCNTHEDNCPSECPNDCTDGVCNTHEDNCPSECPNDCTDGVCNTHEECPSECPNDCTDGVCNTNNDCEPNSYQCGKKDHILRCKIKTNMTEVNSAMNLNVPNGCIKGDSSYYCQGGGTTGSLEDACKCIPNDSGSVYCVNDTGYLCKEDNTLINIGCSCYAISFNTSDIVSEDAQCQYKCKSDGYFCNDKGILKCNVDVPSKVQQLNIANLNIANSYVVTPNNDTNKNKLLEHCLNLEHPEYLCEPKLESTALNNGQCCTPEEGKLLCFAGKAYECTKDGRIDKATEKSCKACEGDDKNGTKVAESECSITTEPESCDNPGYSCNGQNSLICSLDEKSENGKTDDICCTGSNSPTNTHCEGCLEGYYRCGATNQSPYNPPTTSIGTTSHAYKCTNYIWNEDKDENTHVLGIILQSISDNVYRLFDCSITNTEDLDNLYACSEFTIDGSAPYPSDTLDNIKVLYNAFKEGTFNTVEFSCSGDDVGSIVDKDYYVYVQRDYKNDFSDNIGTNMLYKVTAEKGEPVGYGFSYKITIKK